MKTKIKYSELTADQLERTTQSTLNYVSDSFTIVKQLSELGIKSEVVVNVNELSDCGKYGGNIENSYVRIFHDYLQDLHISYDKYTKKYSISNWHKWEFVSSSWSGCDSIEKPKNIGVLSLEKVNAWIKYEENCFIEASVVNEKNRLALVEWVSDMRKAGLYDGLKWYHKLSVPCSVEGIIGKNCEIERNFIRLTCEISIESGYVNMKKDICYGVPSGVEGFLLLSDNGCKAGGVK